MELLSTLKDSDIFENSVPEPREYKIRPTAKGLVYDKEGNIALLEANGHFLLPGGGIEEGETGEEAFVRECIEEIGCEISVQSVIGLGIQYRAKAARKYEVSFYVGTVTGEKGIPTTVDKTELACILSWRSEDEVRSILENQWERIPLDDYPAQFNTRTHYHAFMRYMETK